MTAAGIIDYGMGNLRSVANAVEALGSTARILRTPAEIGGCARIILPGVGAFGDGMKNLRERGWVPALEEAVVKGGRPFMGLCLGMQLLATTGTEHGSHAGLNWIPGAVGRLQPADVSCRVPHIGWNDVQIVKTGGLYRGFTKAPVFYFVHSFAFVPESPEVVSGYCDHGGRFAASVESGNIFATQYHPEKSQKDGLQVLRNFLAA